jgi:hypothetical protein
MLGVPRSVAAVIWMVVAHIQFVGIAAYSADWNHYTWWYQATYTVYALLSILNFDRYYFFFFQCLAIQVIFAVLLMSFVNCVVFETAYHDAGPAKYIGGDFGLHYLPNLVALALVDTTTLCTDSVQVTKQVWCALGLFLTWAYFHNPWDVYGCSLSPWFVIILPWMLTVFLNMSILYVLNVLEAKKDS